MICHFQRITSARREDIVLAKTFQTFKIDVFNEDLFDV